MKDSEQPAAASAGAVVPRSRDWLLLLSLVLIWAASWPVIKIGVGQIAPIWYGCLRYAIAALILFVVLIAIVSLVAADPLESSEYASRVAMHEELVHVTIETHRCSGAHPRELRAA